MDQGTPEGTFGGSFVPEAVRAARGVPLLALAASAGPGEILGERGVRVLDVTHRLQEVRAGSLFFCVPGERADGHDLAPPAEAAGAVAVVVERPVDVACAQLLVPSVRRAMGPVSAEFFGHPSRRLVLVGVTGTNGKTTTTYLLESVFGTAGMRAGVIGTTGVRIDGEPVPFERTTPEGPDLQRVLARMVDRGVGAAAMEVSSHGLAQHRVDGARFACSVFTNLSQDHLDYHGTMEAYLEAKYLLFTASLSERAAVNGDVEEGRRLADRGLIPTVTFGLSEHADVRATGVRVSASGIAFDADGVPVRSRLRGTFNVYNCLGAYAAARQVDIDGPAAAEGIARVRGVPGRFEAVASEAPFTVLVDYAHTPDGLENVLAAARELTGARLIVVFGCGGDRDRGKRPLMGRTATAAADLTVITSDNPRSEDPAAIVREIEAGARAGGGRFVVEVDRGAAIRLAIRAAEPGDLVVVAGKGHETGQEFAGRTILFDDRVVAARELAALGFGEGP